MNIRKKLALLLALTMLILPVAVTSCADNTQNNGPVGDIEDWMPKSSEPSQPTALTV